MITDYLERGVENALSSRELAEMIGSTPGDVYVQIEQARDAGWLICSRPGPHGGYYFSQVDLDFFRYCETLEQRVYKAISVYARAMTQASSIEPGSSMSRFCERYSRDARQKMHKQIDDAHRIRNGRR